MLCTECVKSRRALASLEVGSETFPPHYPFVGLPEAELPFRIALFPEFRFATHVLGRPRQLRQPSVRESWRTPAEAGPRFGPHQRRRRAKPRQAKASMASFWPRDAGCTKRASLDAGARAPAGAGRCLSIRIGGGVIPWRSVSPMAAQFPENPNNGETHQRRPFGRPTRMLRVLPREQQFRRTRAELKVESVSERRLSGCSLAECLTALGTHGSCVFEGLDKRLGVGLEGINKIIHGGAVLRVRIGPRHPEYSTFRFCHDHSDSPEERVLLQIARVSEVAVIVGREVFMQRYRRGHG